MQTVDRFRLVELAESRRRSAVADNIENAQ
jgi:hypothetical protein